MCPPDPSVLFFRCAVSGRCKQNPVLNRVVKPNLISVFGDIANAVGSHFLSYLGYVMTLIAQAASTTVPVRGQPSPSAACVALRVVPLPLMLPVSRPRLTSMWTFCDLVSAGR